MMRDTIHRVAGALSEGRPDAVVRSIQNSFLVRPRPPSSRWHSFQAPCRLDAGKRAPKQQFVTCSARLLHVHDRDWPVRDGLVSAYREGSM